MSSSNENLYSILEFLRKVIKNNEDEKRKFLEFKEVLVEEKKDETSVGLITTNCKLSALNNHLSDLYEIELRLKAFHNQLTSILKRKFLEFK